MTDPHPGTKRPLGSAWESEPPGRCSLRSGQRPPGRGAAFTLIELLTVIGVIAIMATLLMSALGSAKRKSRQVYCTSNLRQISLALNMYVDDFDRRPSGFQSLLVGRRLLDQRNLLCPEDRLGNWGGRVWELGGWVINVGSPDATAGGLAPSERSPAAELAYSYFHPLKWSDEDWKRLTEAGGKAGIAACQLHGLGSQNRAWPSYLDYQGLLLRAQMDGAVVRRALYWQGQPKTSPAVGDTTTPLPGATFGFGPDLGPGQSLFFLDEDRGQ